MSTNKIGFNNFKAFGEKMQTFSKKPITLVYGPNSIGKSSLLHSQLYFEYIKESGICDLYSTKFAGDEFDLNGFDNFVHKKNTKNSINFEILLNDRVAIYDLLSMFNRGLTLQEIDLLSSSIKTENDAFKLIDKIDKETYEYYATWNMIGQFNKFKSMKEKSTSMLSEYFAHNSKEANESMPHLDISLQSIIDNLMSMLMMKFTVSEAKDIILGDNVDLAIKDFKEKSELTKIKNEKDIFLKTRMLDLYAEKWIKNHESVKEVEDIELIIFKLLYTNVSLSHDNEYKKNIAQNLMFEVEFLTYIFNIDNLKINFEIKKSSSQSVGLNIHFNIDGEKLFEAKHGKEDHTILINKNNSFLLQLDKRYKSFLPVRNEKESFDFSKKHNLISNEEYEEFQNMISVKHELCKNIEDFSLALSWAKDDEKLLSTMTEDLFNNMFRFFESMSWKRTSFLKRSTEIISTPLVYNVLLFVIAEENNLASQYFGPLRFYPNRVEHIVRSEIDQSAKLDGETIWEFIKTSQDLQSSLNELLSNKTIFNTVYRVEVQKKLNIYSTDLDKLNLENKSSYDIQTLLNEISKIDHELVFIDKNKDNTVVSLREMGLGNSQMIPFLLLCKHETGTKFFIEQPELHLHPAVQSEIADEFIRSYKENKNEFIIETHSEHLLLRMMKRMRNTAEENIDRDDVLALTPDDVCVLYVDNDGESTYIQELRLSKKGTLLDSWPNGFFEEGFKERFG